MEFQKLTAEVRTGRKKGVARRLRRDGRIPAVCYGPDRQEALALSVDPKALTEALSGTLGRNTVLELAVDGDGAPADPILVMLQDAQYHPIEREMLHADFLTVSKDREVNVDVPLLLEGKSVGVQAGGILTAVFRELNVTCRIDAIPDHLTLDVSALDIGDITKVTDLQLPDGVRLDLEPTQTLASVIAPSAAAEEEEEKAEGEEGEEGEGAAEGEDGEKPKEGDAPAGDGKKDGD